MTLSMVGSTMVYPLMLLTRCSGAVMLALNMKRPSAAVASTLCSSNKAD